MPASELPRKRLKPGTVSHNCWIIELECRVGFTPHKIGRTATVTFSYALEEAASGPLRFRARLIAKSGEKRLLAADLHPSGNARSDFAKAQNSTPPARGETAHISERELGKLRSLGCLVEVVPSIAC